MVIATIDGSEARRWTDTVMQAAHMPPATERPHILIAGLGNILMGDDGIGVHVIREIATDLPAGAVPVEIGTAVLDAIPWLEWADAVLAVDALCAHGNPGTVYRIDDAVQTIWAGKSSSLHELGILQAMSMLPIDRRPRQFVLIGVEPGSIHCGLELSTAVRAAIPAALVATRIGVDHCGSFLRFVDGIQKERPAEGSR